MKPHEIALMGAGGGGGSESYTNTPDNLRSVDTFETILGLTTCEVELKSGGLQNLFVNDIPVEDSQGNSTFTDFSAHLFNGDPTTLEPVELRLGQSSGPEAVNLTLSNSFSNAPGNWVLGAVTTPGVNFIDLRFVVQSLYKQTKKGIFKNTATVQVELRPSGFTQWINPNGDSTTNEPISTANGYSVDGYVDDYVRRILSRGSYNPAGTAFRNNGTAGLRIQGKTNSPYIKEYRIAVPNEGDYANVTWEVRCRLVEIDYEVTGEDGENEDRRTIVWESAAGVSSTPIGGVEDWRGLAYAQFYGKATDQLNGIPKITGIYDIGKPKVPPLNVWDPDARTFTGASWDGATFIKQFTRDPAWQIKHVIEDDLSGISALAPGSTLNVWDTLEACKWFSEQVPDGRGGTQPRYSLDWFLEKGLKADELVKYLAGAVGAFAWDDGNGNWRMRVEKPENPTMTFTKENIVGDFIYSHTDIDTRKNDFTAVFRNEDLRYKEDRVRVFDQDDIDLRGRQHVSIALVGCTNRQEALRRTKLRQLTSLNETRMVNFVTNRQGLLVEPLSVIAIADGDLNSDAAIRSTGRIVWIDPTRQIVDVRDPLRLEHGVVYRISLTIPNPDYDPERTTEPSDPHWRDPTITITRTITNTNSQRGDINRLYLDEALPDNLPEFAVVALDAPGLPALPKQYRVLNVTPNDSNPELVTISAMEIYTSKWAEADAITEQAINAQIADAFVPAPTAPSTGVFEITEFRSEYEQQRVLTASWVRPATLFLDDYRVEYSYNDGPFLPIGTTRDQFFELPNARQGLHSVRIYARDRRGLESLALEATADLDELLNITEVLAGEYGFGNLTPDLLNRAWAENDAATIEGGDIDDRVISYESTHVLFDSTNTALRKRQVVALGPDDIWEVELDFEAVGAQTSLRFGYFGFDDTGVVQQNNAQGVIEGNIPGNVRQRRRFRIGGIDVDPNLVDLKCFNGSVTVFAPHARFNVTQSASIKVYGFRAVKLSDFNADDIGETGDRRWAGETGADLTKSVGGAGSILLAYESDGVTLKTGETPKTSTYSLVNSDGTVITSGVTWSATTIQGSFSGTGPSMTGTGAGQLTINSGLAVSVAIVRVTATYEGRSYNFSVEVEKQVAGAASTGSSGSSTDFAQDTSLDPITSTNWNPISAEMVVTTLPGSTEVDLTAGGLSLYPQNPVDSGAANCRIKWQWWDGAAWVDVGLEAESDPDPSSIDEGGFYSPEFGSITCNRTKTGLTASTEYTFRLMGKHDATTIADNFTVFGSCSIQG